MRLLAAGIASLAALSCVPHTWAAPDPFASLRERAAVEEAQFAKDIEAHGQAVRDLYAMRTFLADRKRLGSIRNPPPQEAFRTRNDLAVSAAANTMLDSIDWTEFDALSAEYLRRWTKANNEPDEETKKLNFSVMLDEFKLKVSLIKPAVEANPAQIRERGERLFTQEEVREQSTLLANRALDDHRGVVAERMAAELKTCPIVPAFPDEFDFAVSAKRLRMSSSRGYQLKSDAITVAALKLELLDLSDEEIEKRMVETTARKSLLESKGAYRTGSAPVLKSRSALEAEFETTLSTIGNEFIKPHATLADGSLLAVGDLRSVAKERLAGLSRILHADFLFVHDRYIHGVSISCALGERAHSGLVPSQIPFHSVKVPGTAFEAYNLGGQIDRVYLESPSFLISISRRAQPQVAGERVPPMLAAEREQLIEMVGSVIDLSKY